MKENLELAQAIIEEINGLPFISRSFQAEKIFLITLGKRQKIDNFSKKIESYIFPSDARELFSKHATHIPEKLNSSKLSEEYSHKVEKKIEDLKILVPSWKYLFSIPVDFFFLKNEIPSLTSALIPQTIFLGDLAFKSDKILQEIIIHEYAHLWLNLIFEITDVMYNGSLTTYTLPSGTKGKNARSVLLAGHFAASIISFFDNISTSKLKGNKRVEYLSGYLSGCLELLNKSKELTLLGHYIKDELQLFNDNVNINKRC